MNEINSNLSMVCARYNRTPPPLEFAKLNIADIIGNEKNSSFSHVCTSTVIRQTESILLKFGPPPPEKISWIRACEHRQYICTKL